MTPINETTLCTFSSYLLIVPVKLICLPTSVVQEFFELYGSSDAIIIVMYELC